MDIKMPVKFHGAYGVVVRDGDQEKREVCQRLNITKLPGAEQTSAGGEGSQKPTHLIVYYSFGCKRMLEGRLKENGEDKVVFQADRREYEFSPARSSFQSAGQRSSCS